MPSDEARDLILKYGWNSTCYQILNEGMEIWWSDDRRSMVGYVRSGHMAIVAGAPVCAEEELAETVRAWEKFAESEGLEVCYFGAESRLQECLASSSEYTPIVMGAQPEWSPDKFVDAISSDASLRAQLNRARNKGVTVTEWRRELAENNPALRAVLQEWLRSRGLPTLHFLVEPETLGDLRDRRVFVAERQGAVVGFVTLCPSPARHGWLTEQFVRSKRAPNGTVELMLFHAAEAVVASRSEYLTMGIVPLIGSDPDRMIGEPGWLRFLRRWARAHYTRFYNFRGLSEFKTKFHPERWQPVVVIVRSRQFRFRHLRAIGKAFTRILPEFAVALGVAKAIRTEIATLARKGRSLLRGSS